MKYNLLKALLYINILVMLLLLISVESAPCYVSAIIHFYMQYHIVDMYVFQLETDLSGYTGDELLTVKELIESLCQYFNVEDDEELEEEAEGTLVQIRVLLKDYGERIKIEKLLKVCL